MPVPLLEEASPAAGAPSPAAADPTRHLLGRRVDRATGPLLVCVAGLHGNEPAGVAALRRVLAELERSPEPLAGGVAAYAGNLGALAAGERFLDRDLNRLWSPEALARAARGDDNCRELAALAGLDAALAGELAAARGPVFLLDLHTTSGAGPSFAVLDDSLANRRFALALAVPLVLGLEEELAGTLVFHWTERGVTCVAFEGGQHDDPESVARCEAATWLALAAADILPRALRARAEASRRRLRAQRGAAPQLVEVTYRHRIAPGDDFRMLPGFASFDRVAAGQELAVDRSGPVRSPWRGRLLMPLYQPQGEDGFFLAAPVARFWFELSATLRRARVDRWLHWLPGVRSQGESGEAFLVSRRIARWLVPQLFHLLGYKRAEQGKGWLYFRRRVEERAVPPPS
jgi:predicted deacylase